MSTDERGPSLQPALITLRTSQTLLLSNPADGHWLGLRINEGILRISSIPQLDRPEMTLAMASSIEQGVFQYPNTATLQLEAIADACFRVEKAGLGEAAASDFLSDWMFQLHAIRHPIKAEDRLLKFFELMISRFGKRTSKGYLLEFLLSHSRIGEIIGATRSTVSRGISTLKRAKLIEIDELKDQLFMSSDRRVV